MREKIWVVERVLLVLFLVAYSALTGVWKVQKTRAAEGAFNIVTSPLHISISGAPGTTLTTEMRVKSAGSTHEKLKVSLMKFSAYGEEGKPAILDRAPGDDYFDWVTFSPTVFDAPPNEWKTIKMTIKLPSTAAYGYYYAAAFSRASSPDTKAKQNVLFGSTAILVLVEAKVPNAKREASILSFKANRSTYEFLPVDFAVKLHNNGNIHLVPSGTISIKRGSKEVASLPVNEASGNVLPKSNRIFTVSWSDGFPHYKVDEQAGKVVLDRNGKEVKKIEWNVDKISHLRIGKYTARLLLIYDDGAKDVPLEAVVSFWVIPWRLIAMAFAILVIPGLIVYIVASYRMRKYKRRFHHRG